MKQIICMKWGQLYGADYVNRLYRSCQQHLSTPFRLVCLTDDPSGIDAQVECHPCPDIALPAPHNQRGWRKLTLFQRDALFDGFAGDWLFLDLDIVITGSLDDFFTHAPQAEFVVMKNWTQPDKEIGNTSVFRFRAGAHSAVLETLLAEPQALLARFSNSQTYVSHQLQPLHYWPAPWCLLYKVHCVPPWPMRFWREPHLPEGARVIAFPGSPNPHEAAVGQWPVKSPLKRLYKYNRPATWIQRAWQETP